MTCIRVLFSGMIFSQLLIFVLCVVLSIGSFEYTFQTLSFKSMACINVSVLQFLSIYGLCHFSTKLTTKSTGMGDEVYNSPWYSLPLKQQNMIGPMIRQGYVPFVLNGFKIFPCSKETFIKMMRTSFSYYVVFRQKRDNI